MISPTGRAEELEEEQEEWERKNRQTVVDLNESKRTLASCQNLLVQEKSRASELERQVLDLQEQLDKATRDSGEREKILNLENKVREIQVELDMEQSAKSRQERTIRKLKDSLSSVSTVVLQQNLFFGTFITNMG